MRTILGIVSLILCGGCITWTPSAQDAANAVALVAPQYASTAAAVAGTIGTKAKSKTASGSVSLEGYTFSRTYRFRGTICEAKDITWQNVWGQECSADKDDIAEQTAVFVYPVGLETNELIQPTNVPTSSAAENVSSSKAEPVANSDEAYAKQGAEDITAIKAAKGRK